LAKTLVVKVPEDQVLWRKVEPLFYSFFKSFFTDQSGAPCKPIETMRDKEM